MYTTVKSEADCVEVLIIPLKVHLGIGNICTLQLPYRHLQTKTKK